jgi:hypothetical protein
MVNDEHAILTVTIDIGENATFVQTDTATQPSKQWKCESASRVMRDDMCCDVVSTDIFHFTSGVVWKISIGGRKQYVK